MIDERRRIFSNPRRLRCASTEIAPALSGCTLEQSTCLALTAIEKVTNLGLFFARAKIRTIAACTPRRLHQLERLARWSSQHAWHQPQLKKSLENSTGARYSIDLYRNVGFNPRLHRGAAPEFCFAPGFEKKQKHRGVSPPPFPFTIGIR